MLAPPKPSKNENDNAKVLKIKTLLIKKDNLDKGVTEVEINGVYKNNFKLVDMRSIKRQVSRMFSVGIFSNH